MTFKPISFSSKTHGGHEVVVYERDVPDDRRDWEARSIHGRVKMIISDSQFFWMPMGWTDMGRAFGNARAHTLDLVPVQTHTSPLRPEPETA